MTAASKPFSRRLRFALSLLLIGHLLAIVLPPLAFQTRGPLGTSPSVSTLLRFFEPYSQFLYVDRGYAFFAPDPGPSHLVQAAITRQEGAQTELMFPDREQQWPRLLYHRHFMLTEFLEEIYHPPGPPMELVDSDPVEAERWLASRARYEHVRQSFIEHLRHEHPGHEVAIRRIEHNLPEVLQFQQSPIDLTDETLYRVILDQPPLLPPEGAAEPIPPPAAAIRAEGEKQEKPASEQEGDNQRDTEGDAASQEAS